MKIGIIREGKTPPDKRVPFTPSQCLKIKRQYPEIELVVESSPIRAFRDDAYTNLGISIVDDVSDCDVLFGVKEVNKEDLISGKKYFFFSHTIKEQSYNRELLLEVLSKNIQLIDYEVITNSKGGRLVGFGRYAGIVGAYNGFLAFGKQSNSYDLKAAHLCNDRKEMEEELPKIKLPNDFKIALTGLGRVAKGAIEVLTKMGMKQVAPSDYLNQAFTEPVFTQLSVNEYFKKPDGNSFERKEVYNHPERFVSNFFPYAEKSNIYIPCHFWDARGPILFTKEEMASDSFKIRTIADISCDIATAIPSTLRPSTIAEPIYHVNRMTCEEADKADENIITVMAVDNLPCELPKDASEDFGDELIDKILPCLLGEDEDQVITRASITKDGKLGSHFGYLENYVKGI